RPDLAGGEELLARAEERLAALQAGDTPVFRLRRGAHHLELGVDPTLRLQPGEPLTGPAGPLAWEELLEYGERAGTHSPEGIWIARGPGFRRGVRLPAARQVDVLPTLLHLQGLPVGEDLPGRVVEEAIDPDFLARHPLRPLPSWDDRAR